MEKQIHNFVLVIIIHEFLADGNGNLSELCARWFKQTGSYFYAIIRNREKVRLGSVKLFHNIMKVPGSLWLSAQPCLAYGFHLLLFASPSQDLSYTARLGFPALWMWWDPARLPMEGGRPGALAGGDSSRSCPFGGGGHPMSDGPTAQVLRAAWNDSEGSSRLQRSVYLAEFSWSYPSSSTQGCFLSAPVQAVTL